jgi:hypothetical protein
MHGETVKNWSCYSGKTFRRKEDGLNMFNGVDFFFCMYSHIECKTLRLVRNVLKDE